VTSASAAAVWPANGRLLRGAGRTSGARSRSKPIYGAGTRLWLTGWTTPALGGTEFVSLVAEVAQKGRRAAAAVRWHRRICPTLPPPVRNQPPNRP
jgi:hypothetical protein